MNVLQNVTLPVLPYVVCDATGEIVRFGTAPGHTIDSQAQVGEVVFMGSASNDQYVDLISGSVIDKLSISPVVNGLEISGLPDPCDVTSEGVSSQVAGGTVTLEFDVPGTYYVTIEALHRLPATVMVTQP